MLETVGAIPAADMLDAWRARVVSLRALLGWPDGGIVARVHRSGASLAFAARASALRRAVMREGESPHAAQPRLKRGEALEFRFIAFS